MAAQPEQDAISVRQAALDDLDRAHAAWLAGWQYGYAAGRKASVEEMARALLHEQAVVATGLAVDTARRNRGTLWSDAIREQAEGA